jgi:hypothetical protein
VIAKKSRRLDYKAEVPEGEPRPYRTVYVALCGLHAGVFNRMMARYTNWSGDQLVPIEGEAREYLQVQADERAAAEAERQAKRDAERAESERIGAERAAADQLLEWQVNHVLNGDDAGWYTRPVDTDRYHIGSSTIKVGDHYGQPVLEMNAASRLTPNAAQALYDALGLALDAIKKGG